MLRATSMGAAFHKLAQSIPKGDLGIGHHIKFQVNNTPLGVKREPDVFLNTEQFTGPYNPPRRFLSQLEKSGIKA